MTDKLLTRSVVNFKVSFMLCLQEHFSMFPWAKIYKFIIDRSKDAFAQYHSLLGGDK